MPRALVAMSGGVDSAAAALIMQQRGYEVCGVTLILNGNEQDAMEAKRTADKIGIDHYSLYAEDAFNKRVIDDFVDCYCGGLTPNPCIVCNKLIKFGILYDEAMEKGFDVLVTGHYARLAWDYELNEPRLTKAADHKKDQSYVLYQVPRDRFKQVVFPLGEITKEQSRSIVREAGIDCFNRSESQDICFIKDGDYAAFILARRPDAGKTGAFCDANGKVLGEHKGLINYTVGQRRGLGVPSTASFYVLKKNAEDNTITLGYENELYTFGFGVHDVNVLCPSLLENNGTYTVRTRYHQAETKCTVTLNGDKAEVTTNSAVRIPAPGQSAVFYHGDIVVAGGIID